MSDYFIGNHTAVDDLVGCNDSLKIFTGINVLYVERGYEISQGTDGSNQGIAQFIIRDSRLPSQVRTRITLR